MKTAIENITIVHKTHNFHLSVILFPIPTICRMTELSLCYKRENKDTTKTESADYSNRNTNFLGSRTFKYNKTFNYSRTNINF